MSRKRMKGLARRDVMTVSDGDVLPFINGRVAQPFGRTRRSIVTICIFSINQGIPMKPRALFPLLLLLTACTAIHSIGI